MEIVLLVMSLISIGLMLLSLGCWYVSTRFILRYFRQLLKRTIIIGDMVYSCIQQDQKEEVDKK